MSRTAATISNRNNHVGRFGAFLPVKKPLSELMRLSEDRRNGVRTTTPGDTEDVADLGDAKLVRYRHGSDALYWDAETIGDDARSWSSGTDGARYTALFGLIDKAGNSPAALLVVFGEHSDEGPRLATMSVNEARPPRAETMIAALNELDCPASWRMGVDTRLANEFDIWSAPEGGFERREPEMLVAVTMHRACFSTTPTINERIDVFLLPDPDQPLTDADKDTIYWAKDHYRAMAFERLDERSISVRPGFSSWMTDGDPRLVKVTGTALNAEIDALRAQAAGPTP